MQELTSFLAQHSLLSLGMATVLVLLMVVEVIRIKRGIAQLSPQMATSMINRENAVIIDVRTKDAFKKSHIIGAISLPAAELIKNTKPLEKHKAKPLIFVCQNGSESQRIANIIHKLGYNAFALHGGIRAWCEAQMPLIKE
jgi:rhodanese-related sulfurtransferase